MHPDSILTNPVVAKLLHSLSSPNQIQHSLDEFCNEVRSKQGIVRNIIGDLVEFLTRYIKNKRLSLVWGEALQELSVVPTSAIDSIRESTAQELSVVLTSAINLIRETAQLKKDPMLLRAQEQVRISHRVIKSIRKTAQIARLEKDAMVLREQELVRDSLLQCERLRETARLEKDAMVLKAQEQALISN